MILLFSFLLFLAVALAVGGSLLHRRGATSRALERRLHGLTPARERALPRVEVERDIRYSAMPWLDRLLRKMRFGEHLDLLIYQSGLNLRAGVLVMLIAVFAIGGYLVGVTVYHRLVPGLIGLAVAAPMPYLFVLYHKNKRMQAFAQAFPDALDLLVSALRAGLSFSAAMQMVAEESPEPIRGEFAVTVEEQALGLDFRESLMHLLRRVDSLDLRFFVTAVILQRETGGNLAEILENTARLIRDRFRVLGDVKTFTAQGKLTGTVLVLLPLVMIAYMFSVNPEYFKPMVETHGGRTMLIVAGVLQVLGMLSIRKIVNVRV
jgi:tight adherence protein B